jgi:hypothetical protein
MWVVRRRTVTGVTELDEPLLSNPLGTFLGTVVRSRVVGMVISVLTVVHRADSWWFTIASRGWWFVGDFEQDQFLDHGTFVLKWLQWVVGWARGLASAEPRWRTPTATPTSIEEASKATR